MNKKGIINLLYTPQIEEEGYCVICDTQEEWIVYTPDGTPTVFKRDTGLCNIMP